MSAATALFIRALFIALGVMLPFSAVQAERADRDQPLNIEADHMVYDDLKQVSVFTGHVVATKGTIMMKADKVLIYQDPAGYQYATATVDGNGLAYFRQKRDGGDEYIDGYAKKIDYDGKRDFTTLTTGARVRRLRGLTKVVDEVYGSVLTVDNQRSFYTAAAGPDIAGPGNPTGRVRAMLAPRHSADVALPLEGTSAPLMPADKLSQSPPS